MTEALPEPDRLPGAPHPRETFTLYGQGAAEAVFLAAIASGRAHHAWLLTGPRGVGKATLAWRIARFLLSQGGAPPAGLFGDAPAEPVSLDIPPDAPVARRTAALSEPRLFLLRRGPNDRETALSDQIRVNEVRELVKFLQLSSADGGARAVIVDAADEMNVQAANALLKMLEEPPQGVTFLLVSHRPQALLPTIRSRCRELRLAPLSPDDVARVLAEAGAPEGDARVLAALAAGSAGEAVRLAFLDGPALYARLVALAATMPAMDRGAAIALADAISGKARAEDADLALSFVERLATRLAAAAATGKPVEEAAPGETAVMARLAPHPGAARLWAEFHAAASERHARGLAVNLDPAGLLLDTLLRFNEVAGQVSGP
jgi:DNA polymerase-3 subunit delta'